jgi:hypothetical protein
MVPATSSLYAGVVVPIPTFWVNATEAATMQIISSKILFLIINFFKFF